MIWKNNFYLDIDDNNNTTNICFNYLRQLSLLYNISGKVVVFTMLLTWIIGNFMVAISKYYLQKQRSLTHFAGIRSVCFHISECRQLSTGQCEAKTYLFTSELVVLLIRRGRNSELLQSKETHRLYKIRQILYEQYSFVQGPYIILYVLAFSLIAANIECDIL